MLAGREVIWLLVRMSQRSFRGKDPSGMVVMLLPLKAIISSERHWASSFGKTVKLQSEKKAILSLWRRLMSFGSVESGLPDKSRISRVLNRSRISRGNSVRPRDILIRFMPLYWPDLSPSSDCWFAIDRNWKHF